jgi:hypothetical protein
MHGCILHDQCYQPVISDLVEIAGHAYEVAFPRTKEVHFALCLRLRADCAQQPSGSTADRLGAPNAIATAADPSVSHGQEQDPASGLGPRSQSQTDEDEERLEVQRLLEKFRVDDQRHQARLQNAGNIKGN